MIYHIWDLMERIKRMGILSDVRNQKSDFKGQISMYSIE